MSSDGGKSRSRSYRVALFAGSLLLFAGVALGLGNLLAGQAIGEFIWGLRGNPYDIGPELLFWARRGLVVAGLSCVAGCVLLVVARGQRRSG